MKKRIVRLTESDLERLVTRIIKEQGVSSSLQKKADKVTDKAQFDVLAKALEGKNAAQQAELIISIIDQFNLKDNIGPKFRSAGLCK